MENTSKHKIHLKVAEIEMEKYKNKDIDHDLRPNLKVRQMRIYGDTINTHSREPSVESSNT
jgi:hypothetical protein